jgi:protease-4
LKNFFKTFFASFLALVVFFGLIFVISFGLAAALIATEKNEVGSNAVLVIDLTKELKEQEMEDPFQTLTGDEQNPDFLNALRLIEYAAKDSSVKGIYLVAKGNANGYANSDELRRALVQFKNTGKFIYAYGDYITQKAYGLVSVADKIYCHPKGMFEWQGMSVEYVFFKNLIDKLEVKPQIFYAGKFKSATEPFRATEMSLPNKIQTSVWLNDIYGDLLKKAADARKKNADSLKAYANDYRLIRPEDAYKYGLLDGVKYDDEFKSILKSKLKLKEDDKINFVTLANYNKAVSLPSTYSKDKIALVVAEGDIVYGKGTPDQIASDQFLTLLRKIRLDKSIKAIVLRVNSPGGSSFASEIIWRELELSKKAGKKVIVSMGNVAASGGYYIACNADKIFVQPNTITGSIGVFSIVPDFSTFFKNKLGITFDRIATSPYADAPSVTRAMTESEKRIMQNEVDHTYHDFLGRVADGRHMKVADVDSIAQGRVWTGARAIHIGLADSIGGLEDAIKYAAKSVGLKEFKLKKYPEPQSMIEYFINKYSGDFVSTKMEKELGAEQFQLFKRIQQLKAETGEVKARLPFEFSIH